MLQISFARLKFAIAILVTSETLLLRFATVTALDYFSLRFRSCREAWGKALFAVQVVNCKHSSFCQ